MKYSAGKKLLLLYVIAGFVLSSCNADEKMPMPDSPSRYVEISGGMEKAEGTRVSGLTSADGKMDFKWDEDDKITVVTKDRSRSSVFTLKSIDPSDGSRAVFVGELPGEGNTFDIFYKYDLNAGEATPVIPDVQTYQEKGVADGTVPMAAINADISKGFSLSVIDCSVFRFKVKSNDAKVLSHIVLIGYLADTTHIYSIDCDGKVTLSSSSSTEFNIVADAGTDWSGGFSLILTSADDKVATKDKTGTVDVSSRKGKVLGYPEFTVDFKDKPDGVQLYAGGPYWSVSNLGASDDDKYGKYYAWGEIAEKTDYSWENYFHGTKDNIKKYTPTDRKTTLDSLDDAATQKLGTPWRIPTQQEMQRLKNECEWTSSNLGTILGVTVSGKGLFEGKSIFLPASGHIGGNNVYKKNEYCEYWCSFVDRNSTDCFCAWALHCDKNTSAPSWFSEQRYLGKSIRPVCSAPGVESR